jgi:hypothetical protein
MPDGGWFMVNKPRKKMVYEDYLEDVADYPELYKTCTSQWFNTIWREHFPEVRLRKHCRFAKCSFCVKWRQIATDKKVSSKTREDAKNRLKMHVAWAHKDERGYYHSKRAQAIREPAEFISIAIDGTDKFPNGFPHFFEKTKSDDGMRFKLHTICVCVHGSAPYIYLAHENILSDPNLTCEVLMRVLLAEERKRGSLPKTLYLQFDNCWRENKNTYTEKFLEWLVERGVHRVVNVSFLPVGHTHFDPDQLASRIDEVLKHRNVTSIDELIRLLNMCYTPRPDVEFIHDVLDWRSLLNPEGSRDFPVHTAMCRRARGLCTKSVAPAFQYFMPETSPLHWFIRRDTNGHVFLQTQHTVKDKLKSQPVYHWNTEALRPGGRECGENESGLLPSDLTLAPRAPLTAERQAELKSALEGAEPRLTEVEITAFGHIFEELCNPTPSDQLPLPDHHWTFRCETQVNQEHIDQPRPLRIRPVSVFEDQPDECAARERRHERGHCENLVEISNFLAYITDYKPEVPVASRNEFWLGFVTDLDPANHLVQVRRYNTTTFLNATKGENAKYKAWPQAPHHEWIPASRALFQFQKLTDKRRIAAKTRRMIRNALELEKTEAEDELPCEAGEGVGEEDEGDDE